MRASLQHSLAALRATGWLAEKCEMMIPRPGRPYPMRRDLFGCLDVLAISARGILGVQVTAHRGEVAGHLKKFTDDFLVLQNIKTWLAAGGALEIHAWALRGARGQRKLITARVFRVGWAAGALPFHSTANGLVLTPEPDIVLADVLREQRRREKEAP